MEIKRLAHSKYPQTAQLEQIPGVGPITALYFASRSRTPSGLIIFAISKTRRLMSKA